MGMSSPYGPQTGGPWYQPPNNQGAYPNYYQPWPAVSPYAVDQSDLSNENGLWINDLIPRGHNKKMRLRLDYIRALVQRPDGLVGSPDAPSYKRFIEPLFANQQGGGGGGQNQQSPLDPFLGTETIPGFNLYDPANANVVGEPRMKGLRLTLDSTNADGSGLTITGFWAEDDDATFNARDEVHPSRGTERFLLTNFILDPTFDQTDPGDLAKIAPFTVDEILENNLLNLRGIPLDDGSIRRNPDGTVTGGIAAPYDLEFRLSFAVEQYGTGLSWAGAPIYRTKYLRVNPNFGVRYHALREHFGFFGMDSGVFYGDTGGGGGGGGNNGVSGDLKLHSIPNGVDEDGDGIFDNAGGGEDQQQGGGGGGGGGMSSFVTTNDFINIYPVSTIVRNSVYSHMVGPEVGLNYAVSGERLRVGGKSNFSLLGNFEKIRLSGDNVFPTTRQTQSLLPTSTDGRPNRFEESENHAHVSPMFEQSFFVEGPVLEYIPLVRRVNFLKNANLRVGYTLTVIGEVTRPNNAILWTANPAFGGFPQDPSTGLFPRIQTPERETWKSTAWDIGLSWTW
jgi:hypothetical protein